MMIYSAVWLMIALMINVLWWYVRRGGLVAPELDPRLVAGTTRRLLLGPPLYALALLLASFSFQASMAVYLVIGLIYTLPGPDWRLVRQH
jgi:hypothetical protein